MSVGPQASVSHRNTNLSNPNASSSVCCHVAERSRRLWTVADNVLVGRDSLVSAVGRR